ncbi:transposase [Cyanobium sp. LEGE 06143]|uniref:transposase n=1 Tax=Cyanobium sp. LEGE 06143 TaxID=945727 RepID=UPI001D143ACA|nr:transposase [Cyanobium sp. LEGE 06143]
MRPYSEAVKADVRRQMSPPLRQSVAEIAQELGIHMITLYKWRKARRFRDLKAAGGIGMVYLADNDETTR